MAQITVFLKGSPAELWKRKTFYENRTAANPVDQAVAIQSWKSIYSQAGEASWTCAEASPLTRRVSLVGLFCIAAPAIARPSEEQPPRVQLYTNLDEAREAGDRKRREKEEAEGPIISLPSGVKYRELEKGIGLAVEKGKTLAVSYIMYKINGSYLDSLGYAKEGKMDVGETFSFLYGSTQIPRAVELGLDGMRVGGRRRILVRAELGWVNDDVVPKPTSAAASRRIANAIRQPILFEVELVKAKKFD